MPKSYREPKRIYRFIVCDLDGTVLTHDYKLSPRVREAMQAVVDAGGWITISSGRGYQMLKPVLRSLPLNAPVIGCNGGLIFDPATRQILYLQPMPLPLAQYIVRLALQEQWGMRIYLDDMETMLEFHPEQQPALVLVRDGIVVGEITDAVAALQRPPHKLVVYSQSPDATPALVARLQEYVGDRAHVVASNTQIVEIITPGISKATGMSWVASYLGVKREETIAIGDGDNDVEMLEWAGLGIAMGNATPAAKAAADWIAPPVEEDGVAVALQQFVLRPAPARVTDSERI
ncbi:MAG: HAD family phosphatase [Chloroflexi bacterium]|nr:HAD family phosphatase [Chloroflexota bacterium]